MHICVLSIMLGFHLGSFFWRGGGPTHLYVCTHVHTACRKQVRIFSDIKDGTHACSMHIRVSFRIMIN